MPETIGFIGLGVMGRPMALNLRRAGYRLIVHSRSRPSVDALVEAGAEEAASPSAVAAASDVIITMLPDSPDVTQVVAGPNGLLETLRSGSTIIDMSTISPSVTRELAHSVAARGAAWIDAPVSGGEIGAIEGTLSIMVGGDRRVLERVRPILETLGNPERITWLGPTGSGQVCKLCNQIAIGGALASVGEAFALARRCGVAPARVRQALLGGFAASRVLDVHGERILQGNYRPGFRTALYHKDIGLAMATAQQEAIPLPLTGLVQQWLNAMVAAGRGGEDYSALATVIFDLAALPREVESSETGESATTPAISHRPGNVQPPTRG